MDLSLKHDVLEKWQDAVRLANDFLDSPFNLSLPPGKYELDEETGMRFCCCGSSQSIEVYSTTFADIVYALGGRAFSRRNGFIVAGLGTGRDRAVENSLFISDEGDMRQAYEIASTVLHETNHIHYGNGFWRNTGYFLEMVFLFRFERNSAELRPRATTTEFLYYAGCRGLLISGVAQRERWLADFAIEVLRRESRTEHGPYDFEDPRCQKGCGAACGQETLEQTRLRTCGRLGLSWLSEALRQEMPSDRRGELRSKAQEFEEAWNTGMSLGTSDDRVIEAGRRAAKVLESARDLFYRGQLLDEAER